MMTTALSKLIKSGTLAYVYAFVCIILLFAWRQMTKYLKYFLLIMFVFQLVIAANFELAHDEAYYWLFSRALDWGYFDHPPFVAVVIRIFSFLPHSELSVRLGFIILQFLTLGLLLKLIPKQNHWTAALLFFAFPLASFSGLLALPDMPLLFMSVCYFVALKRYLEKSDVGSALILGLCIALLLYAKYHGILLVFFTIIAMPKLMLKKEFTITAITAILLFLPHVFWQSQHDFSTLRYHFLERPSASFSLKRSLDYILTQIALAGVLVGPLVWWISGKFKSQTDFERILKTSAFGIVVFFFISSFSKRVEANWTISLAIPLIYFCGHSDIWSKVWAKRLLYTSFAIVVAARLLFVAPNIFSIKRLKEFSGWNNWSKNILIICGGKNIMANSYQVAAKLSFYLGKDVPALNFHSRKNQFDYWRFDKNFSSQDVCYVTDKMEFQGQNVLTPEDKTMKVVTDLTLSKLQELRFKEIAN